MNQLSDWMKATGRTDESLATELGVERPTIVRYRNGTRRPDWDVLKRLAAISDGHVTADSFLDTNNPAAPTAAE